MFKTTVEREYDGHPSLEITVYNCPDSDCNTQEESPQKLLRHVRTKHCAFCGAKEGVKYRFADHLGHDRPSFEEWVRRRAEDVREYFFVDETIDWKKHFGGVSHTLMEDIPDYYVKGNCWHAILACNDCRKDYRRILEGEKTKIARRDCQPYPEYFDFLNQLKRANLQK
jgi:hypothetical protein